MYFTIIFFIVMYVIARELSSYNERHLFKSHVVLKSKIASKLLIGRFHTKKYKNAPKEDDKMKMTWIGIIYYFLLAGMAVVALLILFVVPKSPCESFDMGKFGLSGSTYNEKAVAEMVMSILMLGYGLENLHTRLGQDFVQRSLYVGSLIVSILTFICFVMFFLTAFEYINML